MSKTTVVFVRDEIKNLKGTKLPDGTMVREDYFVYNVFADVKKVGWKKSHIMCGTIKIDEFQQRNLVIQNMKKELEEMEAEPEESNE